MSTEKTTSTRTQKDEEMEALRAELEAMKAKEKAREEAEAKAKAAAERAQAEEDRRIKVFVKIRRDQPSQIWDPKAGKLLAEFDKQGLCKVQDPKVAKELRKRGYPEVPPGHRPRPTPLAEPDPFAAGYIEEV